MSIYEVSKGWPREERYALTDQIRRSSRSVCANMAEAWHKRRYPRHFASKLNDASTEAAETLVWLDFARDCGYLDAERAADFAATLDGVIGGLVHMQTHPEQWSTNVSEEAAAYFPAPPSPEATSTDHTSND